MFHFVDIEMSEQNALSFRLPTLMSFKNINVGIYIQSDLRITEEVAIDCCVSSKLTFL